VTGAASGIGRAIALRLADEGARLYLLDINESALAEVALEVEELGAEVLHRRCDVSQPEQVSASVQHVLHCWGAVDILVNNAGTAQMSDQHCRQLLAINLQAPIQFVRELLPTMLDQPEAHVLNVASFFGLIGPQRVAAYSASKFGLVGFSESLRAEFARTSLGVTALCPGFVDTNLFGAAPLGDDRQEQKLPPRWMLTTPEKIAQRAVKSIYRNRAIEVVQPYAKLAYYMKRFFPGLLDWASHLSRRRKKVQQPQSDNSSDNSRRVV